MDGADLEEVHEQLLAEGDSLDESDESICQDFQSRIIMKMY